MGVGRGYIFADDDTLLTVKWRQMRLPRLTSAATAGTLCRGPSEDLKGPLGGSFGIHFYLLRNVQKKKNDKKARKQIMSHFLNHFFSALRFINGNLNNKTRGIIYFYLAKMETNRNSGFSSKTGSIREFGIILQFQEIKEIDFHSS